MLPISDYVSKTSEWAKDTVVNIKNEVVTVAQNITSKAESRLQDFSLSITDTNQQQIITISPPLNIENQDLFSIGRPCRFSPHIDKYHRFSNYLRSKMSVVDLVPVDYSVDVQKFYEMSQGKTNESQSNTATEIGNVFSTAYSENIKLFKRICEYHGLSNKYAGIRLYTTDESVANDNIQVDYSNSAFSDTMDSLADKGRSARDVMQSLFGSQWRHFSDDVSGIATETAGNLSEKFNLNSGLKNILENVAAIGSDVILKGNKMTFPKIWHDTSYSNSMSLNIRLISPYGYPAAVKEFIMKPISYLVLLSAPHTLNGVTYGGNIPLTIKAYGMNQTAVGSIRSITFRRGGSETSFNLYKQPLTIDVSIEFQTLFDAFAVFDPGLKDTLMLKTDRNVFNNPELSNIYPTDTYSNSFPNTMMTSLGMILKSLKPVIISDVNIDPQVYGEFIPPLRDDIPHSPDFIPVAGILGSAIAGAISTIDKFGIMIINAPEIIQQGLANAVYNVSKGVVGDIANNASDWINKPSGELASVRTKIIGNIF